MNKTESKNVTGYPHVDKPWMKYYGGKQEPTTVSGMNILDYLKFKNDDPTRVAEIYYGRKYTYDELFYNSELAARVLHQVGIKKGDVIANLISNIPEAGHIWFGATELGAISDFIDPRPDGMDAEANARKVLTTLKEENVKHIVALDFCYLLMLKPIEDKLQELGIENIIIVGSGDSMSLRGKIDYLNDVIQYNKISNSRKSKDQAISSCKALLNKLKVQKEMEAELRRAISNSPLRILRYSDLIKDCQNSLYNRISDENLVNYIGHTSGTTSGRPKPIAHTNRGGILLSEQCAEAGFSPKKGDRAFHLLPFFAPAGALSSYLPGLASGAITIDVSEFYIGDFGYLIQKYKPNYVLATPSWLTLLPKYERLNKEDLSYLRKMIYVGEPMTLEDKKKLCLWLQNHNSSASVETAHGMSEIGGCGSYATGSYDKPGSIGIPLPDTIYGIVDPNIEDRLVPVGFEDGQNVIKGELVISCPNLTVGTIGNKTVVPHYEMNGKYYIRTGDLVEMDSDGVFRYNDRKDRSFCRVDGYKIKPYEIENVIKQNKYVKDVKIVKYFDERKNGFMPKCHVILEDGYDEVDRVEIVKDIVYNTIKKSQLSSRQIPSKFKFREFFPLTPNNKIDFIGMGNEELDTSEVSVDVDETNLIVGDIQIYSGRGNKVLTLK